MAEDKKIDKE